MNDYKSLIEKNKKIELKRKNKRKDIKDINGLTEKEFLKAYKPGDYSKPSVTVDNLIFTVEDNELKILLIKRKNHPDINTWALPGGFVECGNNSETAEEAAYRELKEETNLENIYMEQLYTWSDVNRDPRMRVMSVSFLALIDSSTQNVKAGDDAKDAAWFTIKKDFVGEDEDGIITYNMDLYNKEKNVTINAKIFDIPRRNGVLTSYKSNIVQVSDEALAFDHINIINMGIERLRNKVEYTPIAFNLLPEEFTLPQLQKIYEIILGKKLYKTNFRNKVKPMVVETNNTTTGNVGPSAKLYKYNGRY